MLNWICHFDGVNVVALGAGCDTWSYRFAPLLCTAKYYEVDALGTQMSKRQGLRDAKSDEKETVFLSCDFVNENRLDSKLIKSGKIDADLPIFVIFNLVGGRDNTFQEERGRRNCGNVG
jgi:O-methyltransferase involved in polyketide biosynthesis